MFEPSEKPRVFGLAPGVDFAKALAEGVMARMAEQPPHALARVELIVNTRRMQRRLRRLFDQGPAMLLPRLRLITDLNSIEPSLTPPPAIPHLRRRLELIALVSKLIDQDKTLAPRTSLYDLTDSLAGLMSEMQGEGVDADAIANLDITDQSGHWQRAQQFIRIAQSYVDSLENHLDGEARQRLLVQNLLTHWQANPPQHPIIIAGSTGSRGTTSLLMQGVARLPQGALVLPGYDFAMPTDVWCQLDNALLSEDHPQYRYHKLAQNLDLKSNDIQPWHSTEPVSADRDALISLSLRPAPVTDAWRSEGPKLEGLSKATQDITFVQADTPRREAMTIALRLRQAAEDGQTAALITPDRMLTRQVSAALDHWNIVPDDSAGMPLHLSPPGRFLRHVADLFARKLDAESLLTLLKHPLTHSGADRNLHVLNTQRLELQIRKRGLPYPDTEGLERVLTGVVKDTEGQAQLMAWAGWIGKAITGLEHPGEQSLADWVSQLLSTAENLSAGQIPDQQGDLWKRNAGQKARSTMDDLAENAGYGGSFTARDFTDLLGAILSGEEVRETDTPHPKIMIWGTMEARVQGADLVILGGLNDGTWPEAPSPDPWLNRAMRHQVGLLLPERRIGLSAHDYQLAVAAPEVWITRSIRSDDAETVASRWINRLCNLLEGLPEQGGPDALRDMIKRGDTWLARVTEFERVEPVAPAARPSPRPPLAARPRRLSVTEIKHLIRDPYAIYAKHVLRLFKLGPLLQTPDALLRGTVSHEVLEIFVKDVIRDPALLNRDHFMETTARILEDAVPWPSARVMWQARLDRISDWFVEGEIKRQNLAQPVAFEEDAKGKLEWPDIDFTLTARADRIDKTPYGDVLVYDYKTGKPPSKKEQAAFDKQLLIEAAMIEEGGFAKVGLGHVADARFIGLGSTPEEIPAPLNEEPPREVLAELRKLILAYLELDQGFASRRMMQQEKFPGDYDQLARFGEWDATDMPEPQDLT